MRLPKLTAADFDRLCGKLPAKAPREAEIQRDVVAFLVREGCLVVRVNGGLLPRADGGRMRCSSVFAGDGDGLTCADLLVLAPGGQLLGVEVKRPGKPATAGQLKFLAAVEARGGFGAVVTSVEDAKSLLRRSRKGLFER